jgi:hypothetical protein
VNPSQLGDFLGAIFFAIPYISSKDVGLNKLWFCSRETSFGDMFFSFFIHLRKEMSIIVLYLFLNVLLFLFDDYFLHSNGGYSITNSYLEHIFVE